MKIQSRIFYLKYLAILFLAVYSSSIFSQNDVPQFTPPQTHEISFGEHDSQTSTKIETRNINIKIHNIESISECFVFFYCPKMENKDFSYRKHLGSDNNFLGIIYNNEDSYISVPKQEFPNTELLIKADGYELTRIKYNSERADAEYDVSLYKKLEEEYSVVLNVFHRMDSLEVFIDKQTRISNNEKWFYGECNPIFHDDGSHSDPLCAFSCMGCDKELEKEELERLLKQGNINLPDLYSRLKNPRRPAYLSLTKSTENGTLKVESKDLKKWEMNLGIVRELHPLAGENDDLYLKQIEKKHYKIKFEAPPVPLRYINIQIVNEEFEGSWYGGYYCPAMEEKDFAYQDILGLDNNITAYSSGKLGTIAIPARRVKGAEILIKASGYELMKIGREEITKLDSVYQVALTPSIYEHKIFVHKAGHASVIPKPQPPFFYGECKPIYIDDDKHADPACAFGCLGCDIELSERQLHEVWNEYPKLIKKLYKMLSKNQEYSLLISVNYIADDCIVEIEEEHSTNGKFDKLLLSLKNKLSHSQMRLNNRARYRLKFAKPT